jgi:integrase
MARVARPLSNTEVKQAKAKKKEYNLADGNGLSLRVKPTGGKYWIFNYSRPYTKKRANISFGTYPDLSLAKARIKRDTANTLLADKIDPKEHKEEEEHKKLIADTDTLEYVSAQWFEIKKTQVTDDYGVDIWRSFELHLFPTLGKVPLHKLTAPKAISALKPIAAKGHLETVKRLAQRLNEVMIWAVNTGVIKYNPLAGIGKAFLSPVKEHLPTLKPEQLPELMQTIESASIRLVTKYLIEWQLHTMVRPSEAAGTKWKEIDFKNALWNIPAERMKKKRAHTVPLTLQGLAILESIKPISGHREYVFPADREPLKPANSQTTNTALKRMGYAGVLVAHGLRSLASTTLNEHAFDADVIEAALAHEDKNRVRGAYNRSEYLERRRVMMDWWSNNIDHATRGNGSLRHSSKKTIRSI